MLTSTLKKLIDNAIDTYAEHGVVHICVWANNLPNESDRLFLEQYASRINLSGTIINVVRLTLSPTAVKNFTRDDEVISYETTFKGIPRYLTIPYQAISKVILNSENVLSDFPITLTKPATPKPAKPGLTVVK